MAAIMPARRGGAVRTLACGAACLAAAAFGCLPAFTAPSRAWHPAVSEEPRGLREPRTVMRGRYATGTRSGAFMQGRGRLPMPHNRRPVLAYSVAGEMVNTAEMKKGISEAGGSVIRRLWDMYDQDYNKMMAQRTRYFQKDPRIKYWTSQWVTKNWRRMKRRARQQAKTLAWNDWMRKNGKKEGFTTPITYDGPARPVGKEVEKAVREAIDAAGSFGKFKQQFWQLDKSRKMKRIPDWNPGEWPAPDHPNNVFRYYKRPLYKYPFDIEKMGPHNRPIIRHGNVW